jgi:Protein of unknown function (DUF2971)
MSDLAAFRKTKEILGGVITAMAEQRRLPSPPALLYHYSSLEVLQKILENDDFRLSHAEYSNDQREIEEARTLIFSRITSNAHGGFCSALDSAFRARAKDVDAYIFCMTTGISSAAKPQDMLSQWRAYAQDGRGGALTLEFKGLAALVYHLPGLRINPVIYEAAIQILLIDSIINAGLNQYNVSSSSASQAVAIDATVASLVFALPLMKHHGFSEEREWRLIFMPPTDQVPPFLKFPPRRDFLAPFVELKHLWTVVRPKLVALLKEEHNPPVNAHVPSTLLVPAVD